MYTNLDRPLRPSKHFQYTWMAKWDVDIPTLRSLLKESYKIQKEGKTKLEVYFRHGGRSKKVILADLGDSLLVITGSEG
ncbi:hypothetical protein HYS54_02395 [Candidatus Micrarchaeota archaeon]|nr:hypothetical protein [Candidatus Micrarchaeota archaeon]